MRLITYNLHKGRRQRRDIIQEMVAALSDRDPDVLLCQEVFHGAAEAIHQCHYITEALGDHEHAFGPNAFYRRGCHGNATFARLPVARSANIDVTHSPLEKRGILRTWLHDEDGPLEIFNVHFSLTHRQRVRQWQRLLQELPADDSIPVVVAGDFNDWRGALDRRIARHAAMTNALWTLPSRSRRSFPALRPQFALDRIYLRGLAVRSARVLQGAPWSHLSDHLPVEVELDRVEPVSRRRGP